MDRHYGVVTYNCFFVEDVSVIFVDRAVIIIIFIIIVIIVCFVEPVDSVESHVVVVNFVEI